MRYDLFSSFRDGGVSRAPYIVPNCSPPEPQDGRTSYDLLACSYSSRRTGCVRTPLARVEGLPAALRLDGCRSVGPDCPGILRFTGWGQGWRLLWHLDIWQGR